MIKYFWTSLFAVYQLYFFISHIYADGRLTLVDARHEMKKLNIPPIHIQTLLQGNDVIGDHSPNILDIPELAVKSTHFMPVIMENFSQVKPSLILEVLKPVFDVQRPSRLDFFNSILRLSKLTGLKYYHPINKSIKELIYGAHTLDTPFINSGRADYIVNTVPSNYTVYFQQTDSFFGKTIFQVDYDVYEDEFMVILSNFHSINIKNPPFKFSEEKYFRLLLQYIPFRDTKEGIVYGAIFVRGNSSEIVTRVDFREHLVNIIQSLQKWFVRDFVKGRIL